LTISVRNGLKGDSSSKEGEPASDIIDLGVIDPGDFMLVVDSAVPIRKLNGVEATYPVGETQVPGTSLGIAPMDIGNLEPELTIIIQRTGSDPGECTDDFLISPIKKNVPAALWGTKFQPDLNSDPLVKNVISGFEISAKPSKPSIPTTISASAAMQKAGVRKVGARKAGRARGIERSQLGLKERELDLHWEHHLLSKKAHSTSSETRRQRLLAALGFEDEVSQ